MTQIGTTEWSSGVYQSFDSSGQVNYPLLCCFSYYLGADVTNATGDGTAYMIGTNPLTKIFDQFNSMTTGGVFTAPVTGIYEFGIIARIGNISPTFSDADLQIVTTQHTYENCAGKIGANASDDGDISVVTVAYAPMNLNDTCMVHITVSGNQKVATIAGGLSPLKTIFYGRLVA